MQSKVTADCYTDHVNKKARLNNSDSVWKQNLFVRGLLVYEILLFSEVNYGEQFYTHSTLCLNVVID